MADRAALGRRHPESVVGSAVLVGLVAAIPVAALIVLAPTFVGALASGADVAQAWAATSPADDDWEMIPLFLVGALLIGALIAVVAAAVWYVVAARTPGRPWVARLGAAVAAAAVPLLLLVVANWPLAVSIAVPAALITLVAAPLVGFERPRTRPVRVD